VASASAEESGRAGRAAVDRIDGANEVVRAVQRIAQQSRILSINGSVEATRAGDSGRSFGVVALEMTRLADETKSASGKIEAALGQIGAAVGDLNDALAHSVSAAAAGSKALAEATRVVADLKQAIERLQQSFGTSGR
jgi:methyl-accepting chemotaxis protein